MCVAGDAALIQGSNADGARSADETTPHELQRPGRPFAAFVGWCAPLLKPGLCAQDIKNADLALYELNRVIALEPSWPEVYEQRAEVRPGRVLAHVGRLGRL